MATEKNLQFLKARKENNCVKQNKLKKSECKNLKIPNIAVTSVSVNRLNFPVTKQSS